MNLSEVSYCLIAEFWRWEARTNSNNLGREVHELGNAAPPAVRSLDARRGPGRGCAGARREGSVAGTSLSRAGTRAAPPRPLSGGVETKGTRRGAEPRGKEAEHQAISLAVFFRFVLARGRSRDDPEPRSGRAACSSILRPSSQGRHLRAQRRVVRRRVVSQVREHQGGVRWRRVSCAAFRGRVATQRLELGCGKDGVREALADCVSSGLAAVISWRGPCDGAGKKEAP